jgi:hypothetical protein
MNTNIQVSGSCFQNKSKFAKQPTKQCIFDKSKQNISVKPKNFEICHFNKNVKPLLY